MDFSKFDKQVNTEQLAKDAEEIKKNGGIGEYTEIEKGTFVGFFEKLELGSTKEGRPMFRVQFRITEGEHKKKCLFMNRTVFGTKNDAGMIGSVLGFLEKLDSGIAPITFESYSQLADLIDEIYEEIDDVLEYEIEYDKDAFNNIRIKEVFELE